jgi:hypothetical protein
VYQAFLLFYAGLANDTFARTMPSRSPFLAATLEDAKHFFLQAQQVLPTPLKRLDSQPLQPIEEHEDEFEESESPESTRHSLGSQFSATAPSTTATSISGGYYLDNSDSSDSSSPEASPMKRPSSLFVRKHTTLTQTPPKALVESTSLFSLPATSSPFTPVTSRPGPKLASFYLLKFNNTKDEEPAERDHTQLYNNYLTSFACMIISHISSLRNFRQVTEVACEVRRPTSRDGNGSKEMAPEEKMERIVRGRQRGWVRKRFDPRKYEQLCEAALAEL